MRTHMLRCALVLGLCSAMLCGVSAEPPASQTLPPLPPATGDQKATQEDAKLSDLLRRGATMEEVALARGTMSVKTPEEALRLLKVGNARFFSASTKGADLSAQERRAQILGQSPFAVILSCSDSRVPTEIVFDQTLGDLFAVRVAGNIAEPATVASILYAVEHLKAKLVLVMGHEGCGAVKAAMLPAADIAHEPRPVQGLLQQIVPAVANIPPIRDRKSREREAVIANVRLQTYALMQDPQIRKAVAEGKLGLAGAFYEITSGIVDFYETADELRVEPKVALAAGLPAPGTAKPVAAARKPAPVRAAEPRR